MPGLVLLWAAGALAGRSPGVSRPFAVISSGCWEGWEYRRAPVGVGALLRQVGPFGTGHRVQDDARDLQLAVAVD